MKLQVTNIMQQNSASVSMTSIDPDFSMGNIKRCWGGGIFGGLEEKLSSDLVHFMRQIEFFLLWFLCLSFEDAQNEKRETKKKTFTVFFFSSFRKGTEGPTHVK